MNPNPTNSVRQRRDVWMGNCLNQSFPRRLASFFLFEHCLCWCEPWVWHFKDGKLENQSFSFDNFPIKGCKFFSISMYITGYTMLYQSWVKCYLQRSPHPSAFPSSSARLKPRLMAADRTSRKALMALKLNKMDPETCGPDQQSLNAEKSGGF